ncbi:unnamed protein product [Clavelina lepadiformis]|uniref:Uncharacterized protein n=1 Tax=Clavelina lepadiformis TaxID=159417 RepID=A0ABP0GIP2_CLALP
MILAIDKIFGSARVQQCLTGRLLTIALTTVRRKQPGAPPRNMVPDVLATMAEDRSDNSLDSSQQAAEEVFRKERLLRQTFENGLFFRNCEIIDHRRDNDYDYERTITVEASILSPYNLRTFVATANDPPV